MIARRVLHIRAPLVIKHVISRRQSYTTVVPDRMAARGGCTIVIEGDLDKPGEVRVQVARCSFNDNYRPKVGKKAANAETPQTVPLRLLPKFLADEERRMLLSCQPLLRKDEEALDSCCSDYDFVVRHFLPRAAKPAVVENAHD